MSRNDRNSQNVKKLHEMVFVYNAVMDGWIVKKLRNGKIRLKKKTKNEQSQSTVREQYYTSESEQSHTQQYDLDLVDFIQDNTQLDRIFETRGRHETRGTHENT